MTEDANDISEKAEQQELKMLFDDSGGFGSICFAYQVKYRLARLSFFSNARPAHCRDLR